jgi:Domain of unknown function (DUF5005)
MKRYLQVVFLLCLLNSCKRDPYLNQGQKAYKDIAFTNYFKRASGWIAGDGAYSTPLSNGKSLWAFGDCYINNYDPATQSVPCIFDARSSLFLMDINNPASQITLPGNQGHNSYFLPDNGNNWAWPGPGYQNNDTVYIFVNRLGRNVPDSPSIARILLPGYQFLSYYTVPNKNGINFSYSIIPDSDYYYLYGTKNNGFGNDLFVARYPANNFYAIWQYYDGTGWNTDINSIAKIWDEFTSSFYVMKLENEYVLITTEFSVGCNQGKNIYVATSQSPHGPFTNQHSIWQVDDTLNGDWPVFYIANPHPEFDNGHNELLITYCINAYGDCFNTCFNGRMDPNVYRPKAIRVPYKAIDPAL